MGGKYILFPIGLVILCGESFLMKQKLYGVVMLKALMKHKQNYMNIEDLSFLDFGLGCGIVKLL